MHESHAETSKALQRKLAWLLALCLAWWSLAGCSLGWAAEGAGFSLEGLMQTLAAVPAREARFSETRELSLLAQTLTSGGSLAFQRPDTLIKVYDPPKGLRYELTANRLLIRKSDGREEIVRLDNAPQLQAYVAAVRAVLAGDLPRLQAYFEPLLQGRPAAWQLTLIPRQAALAGYVERVDIEGEHSRIDRFVVTELGGDRTITRLHTHAR